MSDIAIRVENLSKLYHIGATQERHDTLRDAVTGFFRRAASDRTATAASAADTDLWALKDVSFDVKQGEVVGIIGRNGAGKSTLLKILSRITEPTSGRIELHGRVASLLEVGTGFHPELTGRENIYLNGAILGMKRREIERKFDEIVAFAEIERFLDTPVKRYSSGMYVRLAFAVAAHLEPEILLVDEVLAVGDAAFQKKCLGKMGDVAKGGRTVLFVSHNMGAVLNLCHSAVLLDQGQILSIGETNEVLQVYFSRVSGSGIGKYVRSSTRQSTLVDILDVELLDKDGINTQFDISQEIHLHFHYRVNQPVDGSFLGFQVRTATGQPVFTSTNADSLPVAKGPGYEYAQLSSTVHSGEAFATIPALLLNAGTYELHVASFMPGRGLIDLATDIYFDVIDGGMFASRPFNTARQGLILCKIPWEIETITNDRGI